MALDNPEIVEMEMEADRFTLTRTAKGVAFSVDGNKVMDALPSAKINTVTGDVTFMGRAAGTIDPSMGDVVEMADKLKLWFPEVPGRVQHVHSTAEFDGLKSTGLVVAKFSAEWCGPCKMVAPRINKMSTEFPEVTFMHIDGDECKALFRREGASCYPTFMFYNNGVKQTQKVEGADADKVEKIIQELGGVKQEVEAGAEEFEEEVMDICCLREKWRFTKTAAGLSLHIDDKPVIPMGKVPRVEVDLANRKLSLGRGGGVVWDGGDVSAADILSQIASWFPTKVEHAHSMADFDKIIKENDIVCAKFSADWCGPCKAIAGAYHSLSEEVQSVKFLHIDVDACKQLSQREGIQAMPTFHFFVKGKRQDGKMVRGANIAKVTTTVKELASSN